MPQVGTIVSEQNLSVSVSGPGGANTLFITTGQMVCQSLYVNDPTAGGDGVLVEDEFSAPLGTPTLTAGQFKSAIASVSLAEIGDSRYNGAGSAASWLVVAMGARYNAGTGKVEIWARLRVSIEYGVAYLSSVAFQVFTTAAV